MPIYAFALAALALQTPPAPLPGDALPTDWRPVPADELLVMTLADGRTVVVRLAARFAPAHVANIRTLAKAGWWDGESVYRVQENWVAQWGDATEKKPLPAGVAASPAPEFEIAGFEAAQRMARSDSYSTASGFTADGWPIATDGKAAWLTHCYGSVGVARDALPNTGSGAELFTPIGQSARRLDRNYTVVGRIVEGMQNLSSLKRSDAPLGVYADPAERTPIVSVRLASDLPEAARPKFEYRAADNVRFAAYVRSREVPASPTVAVGAAVCDLPVQVRRAG
ncbi:peptidylprolyl isomerase [Sphingomonas qomolangmaensis]|uniref:peptidylprolyl isomerase n=1 Tax=Sphingomonas qomolangmaensis TaxID=2918765 RepID=A0ABY5L4Y0_9SPHN|nr:peptidylprolyl isomerase [Sphingomonas qomolangmaensis]UUL81852.1 peptidylprolyl isomerase [Sphingomonas qomolangmaensis]